MVEFEVDIVDLAVVPGAREKSVTSLPSFKASTVGNFH